MSNNYNNHSNNRFQGKEIQYGESYVLPIEQSKVTISEAKVKKMLKETDEKAQQMVDAADNKSQIIVQTANTEADRIIESARKRAQQEFDLIKEQAYQEGFSKGQEDGLAKFKEDATEALQSLETLVNSSFELKKNIITSASRDIVELISVITDKVCHAKFNPQMLYQLTTDAIKLLNDKEHITIIVSPKLTDCIQQMVPNFRNEIKNLQSIKVIEDNSLSADGVIVETPGVRLDSRISAQINELTQKMLTGGNDGMGQE